MRCEVREKQQKQAFVISVVSDLGTPVSVYNKLAQAGSQSFLFESAQEDGHLARFSFIGVDPLISVSFKDTLATVTDNTTKESKQVAFKNPLHLLAELLEDFGADSADNLPEVEAPFTGGLVGYMGYGAGKHFENIAQQTQDKTAVPDGYYGLYDSVIVFDHKFHRLHVISRRSRRHAEELLEQMQAPSKLRLLNTSAPRPTLEEAFSGVEQSLSADEFMELVRQCQDLIVAGEAFQIVGANRYTANLRAPSLDVYRILQAINPSPYAYLLAYPQFDYVGSSPETFVSSQSGNVRLQAIAGTRKRGKSPQEDAQLAAHLKTDEKELAEHHMLVDLGRNDLGAVCQVGSIKVGDLASLRHFSHVMHLVTEIKGSLSPERTSFDLFQSCFPQGTVSGAPKIRAMQILSRLEPERRGIYSGVVGYFDFHGNTDGAIAIRSALIKDGKAHVHAGAGIVLDSVPESEYEETRNKALSVLCAVKLANLATEGGQ